MSASTYLIKGEDASLVAQEVRTILAEVVGERDQALVVEEHVIPVSSGAASEMPASAGG